MRLSRTDSFFIVAIGLLVFLFGLLLYLERNPALEGVQQVGTITYKMNRAERRFTGQALWQSLSQESPVYNRDTIRTAHMSEAVIHLADGSEITLEDNSLIIIDISGDELNIDFEYGGVRADGNAVSIRSADGEVAMTDGSVNVRRSEDGQMEVSVGRGSADFRSGESSTRLGENEAAYTEDGQVLNRTADLRPVAPQRGQRFFTTGRSTINFNWEGQGNLEIAEDMRFRAIVERGSGTSHSASLTPGTYYWKVTGESGSTETMTFRIIEQAGPGLQSPSNEAVIQRLDRAPLLFNWTSVDQAHSYNVQIASDRNFQNIIEERTVQVTSISIPLDSGQYYWQVRPVSRFEEAVQNSEIRSFRIEARENPDPPRPIHFNQIISVDAVENGISFRWLGSRVYSSYQFQIAEDQNFSNIIFNDRTSNSRLIFQNRLNAGYYFWRILGDYEGQQFISEASSLRIIEGLVINPVYPENQSTLNLTSLEQGLTFRFRSTDSGSHEIIVAGTSDLSSPILQQTVSGNSYHFENTQIAGLSEGQYYWAVRKGQTVSEVQSFRIENRPGNIRLLFPEENMQIDMSDRDSVEFSWSAVSGALSYELRIFSGTGPGRRLIYRTETSQPYYEFTEIRRLSIGRFSWSVEARGGSGSSQAEQNFSIELRNLPGVPEFLTSDREYL